MPGGIQSAFPVAQIGTLAKSAKDFGDQAEFQCIGRRQIAVLGRALVELLGGDVASRYECSIPSFSSFSEVSSRASCSRTIWMLDFIGPSRVRL